MKIKDIVKVMFFCFLRCVAYVFFVFFLVQYGVKYYDNNDYCNIAIACISLGFCFMDIMDTIRNYTKKDFDKKK